MHLGYVLIQLQTSAKSETIAQLARLDDLDDVHHLYGDFDLLGKLRAPSDPLKSLTRISDVAGVENVVFLSIAKNVGDASVSRAGVRQRVVVARPPVITALPA